MTQTIYARTARDIASAFDSLPIGERLVIEGFTGKLSTLRNAVSRVCSDKMYRSRVKVLDGVTAAYKVKRGDLDWDVDHYDVSEPVKAFKRLKRGQTLLVSERPSVKLLRAIAIASPNDRARVLSDKEGWIIVKTA
jgi:hypothetical protein